MSFSSQGGVAIPIRADATVTGKARRTAMIDRKGFIFIFISNRPGQLDFAPPKGGERAAAAGPATGLARSADGSEKLRRRCRPRFFVVFRPRVGLVRLRQTFVRCCHVHDEARRWNGWLGRCRVSARPRLGCSDSPQCGHATETTAAGWKEQDFGTPRQSPGAAGIYIGAGYAAQTCKFRLRQISPNPNRV